MAAGGLANPLPALIEKRFREIAGRYAGCIPVFDCVNEPARVWDVHREHQHRQDGWKHLVPPRDYVKTIFDLARQYFPQNALVLQECGRHFLVEPDR